MIVLDTSVLVDGLAGRGDSAELLRQVIAQGERILVPTLVLYEWFRGPRRIEELAAQEALFPRETAIPFGTEEAASAAELYRRVRKPRGREVDLAIAACALTRDAPLWTLNVGDFEDIDDLRLFSA